MAELAIRAEAASDQTRVDRLVERAFGRPAEAALVRALRERARPQISLVAEREGEIVGHVFFSPVRVGDGVDSAPPAAGLAPLSVAPEMQRRGAGAALVRAGLAACPVLGWRAVFLLGDPAYYARFGFALAAPLGFRYESEAFDAGFQVLELEPGALSGAAGLVHYHAAFAEL